jgi:hypothetical protein
MDELIKTGLSLGVVYTTHYGTTKLYDAFCVPDGITGFLQGMITTASPWCRLTLNIMMMTEENYSSLVLMGMSRFIIGSLFPSAAAATVAATT